MGDAIVGVQNIIGYIFTDPSILWEALQAPGSGVLMSGNRVLSSEGNKRMALVGDAWLKMAIITEWLAENLPKGKRLFTPS
jgi:ribonuclease-3